MPLDHILAANRQFFLIFLDIQLTWLYLIMVLFLHTCFAWTPHFYRIYNRILLSETWSHPGCYHTFYQKFHTRGISFILFIHSTMTNYWYSLGLIIQHTSQYYLWTFLRRRLDGLYDASTENIKFCATYGGSL